MANLVRRGDRAKAAIGRGRGAVVEYLAFRLDTDLYAVPVATIREIVRPPPITPVPRAPRSVLGIMSGRGRVVTVVDARRKLSLPEAPIGGRSRILVTETGPERIGLLVDEVLMVYRLGEAEIELTAHSIGGDVGTYIAGVARPADARGDAGAAMRASGRKDESVSKVAGRLASRDSAREDLAFGAAPNEVVLILLDLKTLLATN